MLNRLNTHVNANLDYELFHLAQISDIDMRIEQRRSCHTDKNGIQKEEKDEIHGL